MAEGPIDSTDCSKSNVKSKFSRQLVTWGPNSRSAMGLQVVRLSMTSTADEARLDGKDINGIVSHTLVVSSDIDKRKQNAKATAVMLKQWDNNNYDITRDEVWNEWSSKV
jgi:hypothetical protein